jgi:hypothetical protein
VGRFQVFEIKMQALACQKHEPLYDAALIFNDGVWLSLVERYVRDVEVASSNLVTPTI